MPTVRISDEQHEALSRAAGARGYTIGRLLSIIIDVALLGIPAILRRWVKSKSGGSGESQTER